MITAATFTKFSLLALLFQTKLTAATYAFMFQ